MKFSFQKTLPFLLLLSASLVQAQEQTATRPYPWEKEGPAVREITIQPVTTRPSLLIGPGDIAEIKRRFEAMPDRPQATPKAMGWPLYALLYGTEDDKQKATQAFTKRVSEVFTKDGKPGFGMSNDLMQKRRTNELLYDFDIVSSFGYLKPEEVQQFQEGVLIAVAAFIGNDPARFPCKATPNPTSGEEFPTGLALNNRWTDAFLTAGLAGLVFPDLPQSQAWVQYAVQQTEQQIRDGNLDGAWPEVPRYHNWTLMLWSGWLAALKNRTGVDFFSSPDLKQLADWQVRFSSPLVRFPEMLKKDPQGAPCNPAWGDSDYDNAFPLCAMYGSMFAKNDPELSKRLLWMWRRAGSKYQYGWQFNLIFPMLVDPSLPDAPQTLGAAFSKRPGYTALRSGFDTPEETWVTMRSGVARNHKRDDLGSIDIFSHGIPLACGAQSGPYQEPELLWNRWRGANNSVGFVSADTNVSSSKNPYVDIPGLQSVSSGTPLAFFSSPSVDYAAMDGSRLRGKETFKWVRHLVLVKDPAYLLVWDQCDSTMAAKWFLHTTAAEFLWEQNAVTSKTAYGVDLDIQVLSPATPLTPNVKEGPFGGWKYADTRNANKPSGPYPFRMLKYFVLDAAPNTDFVTVLQPRKSDAPKLTTKLVSQSKSQIVVSVTIAERTDLITLTPKGGTYQRGDAKPVDLPMTVPESVEPGAEISSHSPPLEHLAATTSSRNPFLQTINLKEINNP
jgi:hypothetical protein